jgi:hypothetical protein
MIRSSSQKGLRHYLEASAGNSAYPDLLDELIVINREELRPIPVRPRHSKPLFSLESNRDQFGTSSVG